MKRLTTAFTLTLGLALLYTPKALATLTPATGGTAISGSTVGGTWTALTGPIYTESGSGEVGTGTIILNLPSGFEFATNCCPVPSIMITGDTSSSGANINNSVSGGVYPVTVTSTQVTFTISTRSSGGAPNTLTWQDIRVRPTASSPLASGNITKSGSSSMAGVTDGVTNFGTLTEVSGTPTKMFVTLPNQTFTSGSGNSGAVATQTVATTFNISKLTAVDDFTNIVASYSGTKTISYSGPSGSPTYTTTVNFSAGQSTTTLATTLNTAETTTITATDGSLTGVPSSSLTVARKTLTVSGVTANNKVYDGNTNATLNTGSAVLVGVASGDSVTLSTGSATGAFLTKTVGTGKTVTVSGLTISGADAGNYTLMQPTTTADISVATVTGSITASNKAYDGTTTATIATRTLSGVIGVDAVSLTGGSATFANKNVGTGKSVTAAGLSLSGADAGNYQLASTSATTTADITTRTLTVSAAGVNKVYDSGTNATVTLSDNRVAGDVLTTAYASAAFANKNAGTAKTVSVSGITVTGTDAANYTFNTTASTTANITVATVTGSIAADNKVYDGNMTATIASRNLSGVIGADVVSLTGGTATFANKNVGTAKTVTATGLSLTGADGSNYQLASTSASTTADITVRTLTVSATGVNKVYDGNTNATVTLSDNRVAGDVLTTAYTTAAFSDKNVGTGKTVTATGLSLSGTDAGNYQLASTSASATANLTARAITVTAVTDTKMYDGTTNSAPTPTISSGSLASGDTANFSQAFSTATIGTGKTLVPSGSVTDGNSGNNYAVTFANNLTGAITTKALTVSGVTANNKTYDATTTATLNTGSAALVGVLSGDTVTLNSASATGAFANKNAGTTKPVTISGLTLSGANAGNYTLTQPTATADISARAITVTAATNTKAYDSTTSAAAAPTITSGSLAGTDTANFSETYNTDSAGTGKTLTPSGSVTDGNSGNNYTVTLVNNTTGVITAKNLTVTGVTASNRVYDGTTVATLNTGSAALVGVLGGDSVTLNTAGATGAFATKTVGTGKTVTVSGLGLNGADAGNYTLTQPSTTANITVRSLTVSATGVNKVYDATTAATVTLSDNRVAGDVLTTSYTSASFADINVGTGKTVSVSGITVTGTDAANYTANTTASTTANITTKALTVTGITANNKTYDGTTAATLNTGSAALVGMVSGDHVSLSTGSATGVFADNNVGTGKTVSVSGLTLSGTDAPNYTLIQPTTTANITARSLTVSATGVNKVYDGTTAATVTLSDNRVAGDVLTTSYTSAAFTSKTVGTGKTVTVSGISISGTDAANYTANTTASTTANITVATVTGSITVNSKVYDATTAATIATRSLSGVMGADVVSLTGGTATFANKTVGTAKTVTATGLSLSGTDAGNYQLASSSAATTANITAATLTGNVTVDDKVYDGTTTATIATRTLTGVLSADVVSLSGGSASFDTPFTGTGKTVTVTGLSLSGTDAGNYQLASTTATTTASITGKALTVTGITASNKIYDRTAAATLNTASASLVGVSAGDDVTLSTSSATGTFANASVGTGKTVTVSGLTISGADAGSYSLTQPTTTANITAASVTVTGITANNKVYDRTTTATVSGTAALAGVISGDTVTVGGTPTASFADKTVTNNKPVTVTGYTLSGADAGNYALTQPAGLTANITAKALTVSGVTANNKAYDGTTAATLNTASASLVGVIAGDTVTLSTAGATGAFADKTVGTGKTVTVSGLTISGADLANYSLTQPSTTANITAVSVTVTGITANNKVYDATTTATLNTAGASLVGVAGGDTVTLNTASATGAFANKTVGTGKTVTASGLSLSGPDGPNYALTQPITTANITVATVTGSITASNKVYDATTAAAIASRTLTNVLGADLVSLSGGSATFADKNVGTGKTVTATGLSLSGTDAGNYQLASTSASATANLTARAITVTAVTDTKMYDGTTNSAPTPTISSGSLASGDTANFSQAFSTATIGTGKTLVPSGSVTDGNSGNNYAVTFANNLTGAITTKALTVSGVTANNKTYDATTTATLNTGSAALVGVLSGDTVTLNSASATGAFANKNVGTAKTVTISGLTLSGANAGNYTLTQPTATADISARAITVTAATNTKAYDSTPSAAAVPTITSGSLAGTDTANFSETYNTDSAGTGKTLIPSGSVTDGNSGNNYAVTLVNNTTGVITAKNLTVTGVTASNRVYDGTTVATLNTGSAALVGVVAGDSVTLNSASATGAFATKTVGTGKTVTVSGLGLGGTDAGNYTLTQPSTTANITVRSLTVSATGIDKVYDATTAATVTLSDNRVAGDVLTTSYTSASFADINVGTGKTVSVSGISISGTDAANYTANTTASTTANITAKPLTVSGITANNKTYDGTAAATLNTGSAALVGMVSGDHVSLSTGSATGMFADNNVGTGKTVSVAGLTLSGQDAPNYTLIQPATTANITAKGLTVSGVTASNKVYDGTTAATLNTSSAALVGVVSGDTVLLNTASATGTFASSSVGSAKTVTASGLTLSGADAGNYSLTQPTTSANITAKGLTVSGVTANNKVYDGTATATLNVGSAALIGVVSGDTVSLNTASATGTFANKNVGTAKTVTISGLTLSGASAGNYTLTQPTATADITARTLTVSATGVNRVYDGTTAATVTLSDDSVAGDVLTTAYTTASFANKNVGTGKTVSVSGITVTGTDAGNYTFNTTASTTANITARAITVTAVTDTKQYDSTTSSSQTPTITLGSLASGDTANFSQAFSTATIGTGKTLVPSGSVTDGNSGNNYAVTFANNLTGVITTKALTVTGLTANSKTYDGTTTATLNTGSAALVGVVSGDSVTLNTAGATGTFANKNVGTAKTVTISGLSLSGTSAGNYTLTQPTATADISARTLTVSASGVSKVYDGTTATSVTLSDNRVAGDIMTNSYTSAAFADKNIGTGKTVNVSGISISGIDAANYTANTTATTTANITAKNLTVSGTTANNKVYDGTTTATLNTASAALVGVVSGDSVTLNIAGATGAFANKNVGTGKTITVSGLGLGGTDAGNYTLTQPSATANITARTLIVTATAANKTYDGTTTATATLADNRVAGDILTTSYTSATFTDKNVGNGKTVSVSGISISGADAANYSANTTTTATANITARALTISATGVNKVYDGTTTATVTLSDNHVAGDVLTTAYTTASFADSLVGTAKTVSVSGITVTGTDAGNYTFNTTATTTANITQSSTTTTVGSSVNPSVVNQSVTFTATVTATAPGSGTPTGTVTFKDGTIALGTNSLSSGQASLTTSSLSVSNHSITVIYNGDTNFTNSTSAAVTQTVNKASTTTTVTSSLNPALVGQSVTFTATVVAVAPGSGTPTGSVIFKDGATALGTNTLSSGQITFTTSSLSASNHLITAVYNGDTSFTNSTSSALTQTVNKTDTTTTLISSANPSVFGQSVSFTATVSPVAGSGTPTGTVIFKDGATALATNALSSAQATFTASSLSVSNHLITAVYSADANFNASTSSALSQTVNKADTTTTLASSFNPSVFGQSVTFTATVSVVSPGAGTRTGTVTFTIDGGSPTNVSVNASGLATLASSLLSVNSHTVAAAYNGDGNFNTSTASNLSQAVNQANSATTVSSSLSPSTFGASVTFTAQVVAVSPGAGTPTGTVTFNIDGAAQSPVSLSAGLAMLTTSSLSVTNHAISAAYSGNGNFNTSTSTNFTQTVNKASSTTTVSGSPNPSIFGQSVTFTATVTGTGGTPTGSIIFKDGATALATNAVSAGQATFATSSLSTSNHTITAVYNGDGTYNTSTSTNFTQTVNKASSSTALASSLNPSVFGQSVTFTATVSPVLPGAGTPTGTVTFKDGATTLGTGTLTSGLATFLSSSLVASNHLISATYNGDGNFTNSASAIITQSVTKAATTTTLASSPNPSVAGQPVAFTATVNPVAPGAGTRTGTVTFTIDGSTSTNVAVNASGQAILTNSLATVGSHTIASTYNGDSNFNGSTASNLTQTVNQANSSTTVSSSLNPSVFGASVTFTAQVVAVSPGAGTPTGTVTFNIDGSSQSPVSLSAGLATLTTSALSVTNHAISAAYSGNGNFLSSTSTNFTQTVNKTNATIGVTSSLNPSTLGDAVTFTATLTGVGGTPTGTVIFKDGATALATNTLSAGQATYATSSLSGTNHTITIVYSGDGTYNTSTSTNFTQTVNRLATTTTASSSVNPSVSGQSVTFTATVTGGNGTPTGTVTFKDSATTLGTGGLDGSGQATFSTSSLSVSNHIISAVYGGDVQNNTSTSTNLTQTVNKAGTSTALSSAGANPSVFGQSVSFTATVTAVAPGAGTPTGSVVFKDGATTLVTNALSSGQATLTTSSLSASNHLISVVYLGTNNFNTSTSTNFTQTVGKTDTTTTLSSSANPSVFGQSVTLTATVNPVAPGSGTRTGTVAFSIDGGSPTNVSVNVSGLATLVTSLLSVSNHAVVATYNGDGNFNGSTASSLAQIVNKANATATVSSSSNPSYFDNPVTFTATVSASSPGSGTPTGTVQFTIDGTNLDTAVTLSGGTVTSVTTSALSATNHTVAAVYNGDANFNNGTSANFTQTVTPSPLTPATGGEAIPGTTAGGAYTSLTGPVYQEPNSNGGDVGTGTIILSAPSGFIFDTNAPVPSVLMNGGGNANKNINNLTNGATIAVTATTTNLTMTITVKSGSGSPCTLTWRNIRVRPTAGIPLASGRITKSGTSTMTGITDGATNFGTLNEVAGSLHHFVIGAISSPQVAGTAFNIVMTAQDQFNNTATSFTNTVALTTTAGTISPSVSGSFTNGLRTESVTVTGSGTNQTITATRTGGTETGTSNPFTVCAPPAVLGQPTNQTLCPAGIASFTVTATGTSLTYQWRKNGVNLVNGATGNGSTYSGTMTAMLQISGTTTADAASAGSGFDCVVTGACGSPVTSSRVGLTVNPQPTATVSGSTAICAGQSATIQAALTGTGPWTVTWSDSVTQNNVATSPATRSVNPASTTTYTVTTVADVNCAGTSSSSATVTVNAIPSAPIASNYGPICAGQTLALSASTVPGATYNWTGPNGFSSTAQNPSILNATPAASGSYSVSATVNGCISTTAATTATVNVVPAAPVASNNGPLDVGQTLNLSASTVAGAVYSWVGPNGFSSTEQNPSIAEVTQVAAGSYSVTIGVGGCTSTGATTSVIINSAPTILCPADIAATNATGQCSTNLSFTVTTSGEPTPVVIYSIGESVITLPYEFPVGTTTVGCMASNAYGSATCSFAVTVADAEPPTISCPADVLTNTDLGLCTVSNVFLGVPVSTNDNCAVATVVNDAPLDLTFATGTNLVLWTATDIHGNQGTCTQQVIVVTSEPPAITCPSNLTVSCASDVPAPDIASVAATSTCGAVTVSFAGDAISDQVCSNRYTITRTYKATDDSGNTNTCQQIITVDDETPPVFTFCPTNVVLACGESADPSQTGSAAATDNCGGSPVITHVDSATAANCTGQAGIDRTWIATDACGNSATCAVQHISFTDTTPPSFTSCPSDVVLACGESTDPSSTGSATATDNCGASPVMTHVDSATANCTGQAGIDRTWIATDACGNSATCAVQHISFTDTTPPSFTSCPSDVVLACGESTDPGNTGSATAIDNCGGSPVMTHVDSATAANCTGQAGIDRTWIATDACGNSATCAVQHISFTDTTPPSFTSCPSDVVLACGESTDPSGTGSATATDNCGGSPVMTHVDSAIAANCTGQAGIDRTWIATDACGNSATCAVQHISFADITPPVITSCPSDVAIDTDAGQCYANSVSLGTPTASDICSAAVTFTNNAAAHISVGTNLVLWIATDGCGNASTCTQRVIVADNEPPTISCPADVLTNTDLGLCTVSNVVLGVPVSTNDNCAVATVVNDAPLDLTFATGTNLVLWTATDIHGNQNTCTQQVIVVDSEPPTISGCPSNLTVSCAAAVPVPDISSVTTTDNCGAATVSFAGDAISDQVCSNRYTITRTYKATDDSGNTNTCQQIITVDDETPPVFTFCPTNVVLACGESADPSQTGSAAATDNCGGSPVMTHVDSATANCTGQAGIDRTWIATDACGNSATCAVQHISFTDTTPPSFTSCPSDVVLACGESTDPSSTGSATATDNCGGSPVMTHVDSATAANCTGQAGIDRTWIATDTCGNSATCAVQHISFTDTTPPSFTSCPSDVVLACGESTDPSGTGSATATDNCGGSPVMTHVDSATAANCTGQAGIDRTWIATDTCGNSATCAVQHISFTDTTPPSFTSCPSDVVLACGESTDPSGTGSATATDNCGGSPVMTHVDSAIAANCTGQVGIDRTWIATDACGNSATCGVQHISFADTTPPVITSCPSDAAIDTDAGQCYASSVSLGTPTASDTCSAAVTFTNNAAAHISVGTNLVLWIATDGCGNASTCTQRVIVADNEPPTISCPADVLTNTDLGLCTVSNVVLGVPVSTNDNCAVATVVNDAPLDLTFATGTNLVLWTATDIHGNQNTCTQQVIVVTSEPPTITCPSNLTVSCASDVPAPDIASVAATSTCGAVTVSFAGDAISDQTCTNRYTITRTYKATDASGTSATCTQTITVDDETAPVITGSPANVTVSCASTVPAADDTAVTATDNCGDTVTITHDADAISAQTCANRYTITRTYHATDTCGNSSSVTQTITVDDETAPIITGSPANVTVSCASTVPAADDSAVTATDNCSGTITITHDADAISNQSCANRYTITRTYHATDTCGNSANVTQTITVNDETAPVITGSPANAAVSCASAVPAADDSAVTASDNCGGTATITHDADAISNQSCINRYTITRTYHASDACGNSSSVTQTITVDDETAPVITSCPADVTTNTDASTCAASGVVLGSPNATDNCGGAVTLINDALGSFPAGTNQVLWTATDLCGNASTCTQLVIVVDTKPPTIACPTNLTVSCAVEVPEVDLSSVSATDTCGTVTVSLLSETITNQSCANRYTLLRIFQATDASGNSATCTQAITVDDETAPVITVSPANAAVSCASAVPAADDSAVTATDNCGGTVTVNHDADAISAQSCANRYTISRVYRATDACGNSTNVTQTITVNDISAPSINCPADKQLQCGEPTAPEHTGTPTATDNCDPNPMISYSDAPTAATCTGLAGLDRTWTATDGCSNSASCVQHITFVDTTPPVISCPVNVTVSNDTGECYASGLTLDAPTASDNCEGSGMVVNDAPSQFPIGTNSVVWTVTDDCGNSATCTQLVIVVDGRPAPWFRIVSIKIEGSDVRVTWTAAGGSTNVLQAASSPSSNSSNSFADISAPILTFGCGEATTNYVDIGATSSTSSRFYRVRLVP